jgi:hypothetical protein
MIREWVVESWVMSQKNWIVRPLTVIETSCLVALAMAKGCANEIAGLVNYENPGLTITHQTADKTLKRLAGWGYVALDANYKSECYRNRVYCLTNLGARQLRAELERLADVVAVGRGRLQTVDDLHDLVAAEPTRAGDAVPDSVVYP